MKEENVTVAITVSIVFAIVAFIVAYKFFAPQSGTMSRFTGNAVVLKIPDDCRKIITFGRDEGHKYLSYIDKSGNVILHEYSDYGVLQAKYQLDKKFDENFKVMD